ncbi:hypothetical protein SLS56_004930 [Neofusicoccum ribis]|uniref:FAD linked oxidase N-terminal domain-containing protein n=1 Tax=Neofusicoccum ribis TaxID=45134 RepID=A0ABR3SVR3_9PEZI
MLIELGNPVDFVPDIHHWYISSSQIPECVLEPGSVDDLATAMQVIGSVRSPFAVKSGGHSSNPGFSSTTGVHISLKRMNQVALSDDNSMVEIGMGMNGTITRVDSDQPDLFFALKGGLNRFGIVASAEFYTHKQSPQVYGGIAIYGNDELDDLLNATAKFDAENTDPKAQIITTLEGLETGTIGLVLFFYDGPDRPASFAPFDNISTIIDHTKTQTFAEFVKGFPSNIVTNARGTFHTFSTSKLTPAFLAAVKNETDLNLYVAWMSSDDDQFWYDAMRSSVQNLKNVAIEEGIYSSDFTAYPNYAISNTTAEELYGAKNAARLSSIRSQVDPDGVMQLAGGFSI